jgi:DNA-binding response OmpR family regulator
MTGRRILLVEDDDSIRTVAVMALEELGGHQVLAFGSGEDALERGGPFQPELLVLDVSLPGMDGPQTLANFRKDPEMRMVPAVFLTAHTHARQVEELRNKGARDVIAKPFDPMHLCDRITAVLSAPDTIPAPLEPPPVALLVEDDPGIRYLICFILQQQGWVVVEAFDGRQGLAAIVKGTVTDAVLLDIMLPHVDGLQLLEVLRGREKWKDVPVMMLTAKGDEASVSRALGAGANDYLAKPFDPAEFVQRLNRLPRKRRVARL